MGKEVKKKSIKIFSGLARSYERYLYFFTFGRDDKWKKHALSSVELRGRNVLDLACGTCMLARYVPGDCKLYGADISMKMISSSAEGDINRYEGVVVADSEYLPFRSNSFDVVTAFYLPKYVRLERALDSVLYVLRSGGYLITYDFSWPSGLFNIIYSFYLLFVFKLLMLVARYAKRGSVYTFQYLPEIIKKSKWQSEMISAIQGRGQILEVEKLTMGSAVLIIARFP